MAPPSPEMAEAARRQREQFSQPTPVETVPVDMPAVPVAPPASPTSAEVAVSLAPAASCGLQRWFGGVVGGRGEGCCQMRPTPVQPGRGLAGRCKCRVALAPVEPALKRPLPTGPCSCPHLPVQALLAGAPVPPTTRIPVGPPAALEEGAQEPVAA